MDVGDLGGQDTVLGGSNASIFRNRRGSSAGLVSTSFLRVDNFSYRP